MTPEEGLSPIETQRLLDSTLDDKAFAAELKDRDCQQLVVVSTRLAVHAADVAVDRIPAVVRQLNRRARELCGGVIAPKWSPSDRIEGAIARLIEQIPADRRQMELKAWFDDESDLANKLAVFQAGRWTDQQQQHLAGNGLLDEMLDAMIAQLEAMQPDKARELADIGRLMWLAAEWLLPDKRDRLLAVLADDWLFARFLYGHTEPGFGQGHRPLAWEALKNELGAEWLTNRVGGLPDEVGPDEEINQAVQTAKHHAERDAAQHREANESM